MFEGDYVSAAQFWDKSGRPQNMLLSDKRRLMALNCWTFEYAKGNDSISDLVKSYLQACEAQMPDNWYDDFLWLRDHCEMCRDTYRVENLRVCSGCGRFYCPFCSGKNCWRDEKDHLHCPYCDAEVMG